MVFRPIPLATGMALMVAVLATACLSAPSSSDDRDPGITDDQILFGQSAALRGPAHELGREMRLGIQAAFHEANQAGGVHGRELKLETINDAYDPHSAHHTTEWLIEKVQVFALIGSVGTPTSLASSPVAQSTGVPFLAPLTGADFLRYPEYSHVINLRASYHQETEEMITRLTEDLGVTRVAVFYQDDSFGKDGLEGVRLALERRQLEPVGAWSYQRHSGAVRRAASGIVEVNPEAAVLIGTQEAVASTIKRVRRDIDPVFMTISFGGGHDLTVALGDHGHGVYVTQVVSFPEDSTIPVVAQYHAALASYDPKPEPGFVSLEGYISGRLAVLGLEACGRDLSRECFIETFHAPNDIDITGFPLEYGTNDNQGSDAVFLTMIGVDGEYHPVNKLANGH